MKIAGKKIQHGPASEIIVFPRETGEDLVFRATAMLDRSEFDKYCKAPKPPKMRIKGGQMVDNPDDERFVKAVARYNKAFMDFMVISSLTVPAPIEGEPDIDIEWELVKRGDPATWEKYDEELKEAGLGDLERKRLFSKVMEVNSLSEGKMDEARKSFLRSREEPQEKQSSQDGEQNDMLYGEPASDSESGLQESQPVGTNSTNE